MNKFSPSLILSIFLAMFFFFFCEVFLLNGDFDAAFGRVMGHLLPLLACTQAVVGLYVNLWWCIDHSTPNYLDKTMASTRSIIQ